MLSRTTTHAFNNPAWPYIRVIAEHGFAGALEADPALRQGLNTYRGEIVHPALAESVGGAS